MHGFVDYFFHTQFADALAAHGYDVYALDLRDYGRSIRDGRPPNHVTDLGTYAEEIDAAIRLLRADHDEVVLLGHSMGGLVTSLWADARRGEGLIDALVLNSPWLDLRGLWFERTVLTGVLGRRRQGRPEPRRRQDRSVLRARPARGHRRRVGVRPGVEAARRLPGTRRVRPRRPPRATRASRRGLAVDVPVLLLASDASGPDDALARRPADHRLGARRRGHEAAARPNLGPDVTFVEIPGGAHDLALSPAPARDTYVAEVLAFLDARLP